jgi:hypothetical protein
MAKKKTKMPKELYYRPDYDWYGTSSIGCADTDPVNLIDDDEEAVIGVYKLVATKKGKRVVQFSDAMLEARRR